MTHIAAALGMLAISVVSIRAKEIEGKCYADYDCDFSCCNYTGSPYVDPGECEEILDVPRCTDRKHTYRIILFCVIFIMASIALVLTFLKRKEVTNRREQVASIKINAVHEENIRKAREDTASGLSAAPSSPKRSHKRQFSQKNDMSPKMQPNPMFS